MKIRTSVLAGLFFISSLGAINSAIAEDGILSKQEFTPGSYCHEKFPAIRPSTLDSDHPTLKSPDSAPITRHSPGRQKRVSQILFSTTSRILNRKRTESR